MQNRFEKHFHHFLALLAVISYFELFDFVAIPHYMQVLTGPFICVVLLMVMVLKVIYNPGGIVKMHFAAPVFILIVSTIPSIFVAYYFHHQNITGTLWASHILLFYLLYFYLHFFRIEVRFLVVLMVVIGLMAVVFYVIQFVLYPKRIFTSLMFEDRGTIRLFIAGMLCTQLAYFYFLNRFFRSGSLLGFFLAIICLSIFILQGTRQFIIAFALLTVINFLFYKRMHSRFLIFFSVTAAIVLIFFLFREIFYEMTKVSYSQSNYFTEGVRIKAARFYLTTFMPDWTAYVFGNNKPALGSYYSQKMIIYTMKNGFYLSDIGIIGDYVIYGALFVMAGLYLVFRALFFRVSDKYKFLKYYIVFQVLTMIAGKGIFSGVDIVLLIILYIFDCDRAQILGEKISLNSIADNANKSPEEPQTKRQ